MRPNPSIPPWLHIELNSNCSLLNISCSIYTTSALFCQPPASFIHPQAAQIISLTITFFVFRTKLNLGKCAFSVVVPEIWNKLPIILKSSETLTKFRGKMSRRIFSKLRFLPKSSMVSRSDENSRASQFTISILMILVCSASEFRSPRIGGIIITIFLKFPFPKKRQPLLVPLNLG